VRGLSKVTSANPLSFHHGYIAVNQQRPSYFASIYQNNGNAELA
jgi:hypothetical protein